jgi:hypothetical protein
VIKKPREREDHSLRWAAEPEKITIIMIIIIIKPHNSDLKCFAQKLANATHAVLRCVIVVVLVSAPVPVMRIEPAIERGVIGSEMS